MENSRKYSRQREAILQLLKSRTDHPTAETLYFDMKKKIPDISLATVYRNLKLLSEEGDILKLTLETSDRFDGNPNPHYHFYCLKCKHVSDLDETYNESLNNDFNKDGKYMIYGHNLYFYGICDHCL